MTRLMDRAEDVGPFFALAIIVRHSVFASVDETHSKKAPALCLVALFSSLHTSI